MRIHTLLLLIATFAACSQRQDDPESMEANELDTRLQIAANQIAKGKPETALRTLRKSAIDNPKNPDVLTIYGLAHLAIKNTSAAVDYLEKAHTLDPTGARSLNLSSAYLEAKKFPSALKVINRALRQRERYLYKERLHQNQGIALIKLGRISKAIDAFERATHINPTYYPAVLELAKLYKRVQEHKKAEAMWNLAHGQCPQCIEPLKVLIHLHVSRGNVIQAKDLIDFYLSQKDIKAKDRSIALNIKKKLSRRKKAPIKNQTGKF